MLFVEAEFFAINFDTIIVEIHYRLFACTAEMIGFYIRSTNYKNKLTFLTYNVEENMPSAKLLLLFKNVHPPSRNPLENFTIMLYYLTIISNLVKALSSDSPHGNWMFLKQILG